MSDGQPHGIATVSVRAGRVGIVPLPDAEAMEELRAWGAGTVISMTTSREMDRPLAPEVAAIGADWAHLPIPDFGAPQPEIAALWSELSPVLHRRLAAGEGVIVHCRGGCGRSGMIALRLMVEAGEPPEAALGRLRAVRPCAVETRQQYDWAAAGQRTM